MEVKEEERRVLDNCCSTRQLNQACLRNHGRCIDFSSPNFKYEQRARGISLTTSQVARHPEAQRSTTPLPKPVSAQYPQQQ